MSTRIDPATRPYRFRSPGDGVYRVRLFERAGEGSAELFFTGERHQHKADLRPGDYWAIVVDVATGTASGRIPVTLGATDQPLTLPGPAGAGSAAAKAAGKPVLRASASEALDQRSSTLSWHKTELTETRMPRTTATGVPYRRFDIGISEDRAPGSIGGWRAPTGLEVQTTLGDSAGGLQVRIRDSLPERKSRIRMSIGLEGLPTVRVPLPLYRDGILVAIRPARAGEDELDVLVEVTAADPKVQTLVAALTELSSDEAVSVLNWATDESSEYAVAFLAAKVNDLWAATAAAVLLVKIGRFQTVAEWLHNLARLAPHIADAAIVAAWGSVAGDSAGIEAVEKEAMHYLARAGRIGAPNYTVANSLNLELLSSLRATAVVPRVRHDAGEEYAKATLRSRFRLFKSPYMIWEEAREKLQGGRLPGDVYLPVARGSLRPEGLTIVNVHSARFAPSVDPVEVARQQPEPAVSIRASVKSDYIVCLEDGKKLKMLKRHLMTHFNMTPDDYRQKWGLNADYPMVAPNYAEQRRALAKKIGLGTRKIRRRAKRGSPS